MFRYFLHQPVHLMSMTETENPRHDMKTSGTFSRLVVGGRVKEIAQPNEKSSPRRCCLLRPNKNTTCQSFSFKQQPKKLNRKISRHIA